MYNTLQNKYDVQLSVFLFGTKELLGLREGLIAAGQDQIVERFMLNSYRFYGIRSEMELGMCLMELDRCYIYDVSENMKNRCTLAEFYFPEAYADDKAIFYALTLDYWDSFQTIKKSNNIKEEDIPMMYFMASFLKMLLRFGRCSEEAVYFVSKQDIIKCIKETGYGNTSNSASEF